MKGFMTTWTAALGLLSGLAAVGGCDHYRNLVDPCYPERYEYAARQEVLASFAPQVHNGHFLDQTIWNYHFEAGTDRLTPGGMDRLLYLIRRRPYPDCTIYLATANDLPYDPAVSDKFPEQRVTLDQRRIHAIQTYLAAQTAGRNLNFEIVVHDPPEVGLPSYPMGISVQKMYLSFQGTLGTPVGTGAPGPAAAGVTPPLAVVGAPAGGAAAPSGGAPAGPPR